MTKTGRSTSVPKGWEDFYRHMTEMTDSFCRQHLNEEYAGLARSAIAALCRKRPSPLQSGKPETWACAVLYALGQVNYLYDKSNTPNMSMQDLCARFGIAASTGGNKAKQVRDALRIRPWDHRWTLPSVIEKTEMIWMVEVDGLINDVRNLPLTVQEEAFRKGIIPYVPAYHTKPDAGSAGREEILDRYREFRALCTHHQSAAATALLDGPVPEIAVRLHLVKSADQVAGLDLGDLAPALDLALYTADADGISPIARYAEPRIGDASEDEGLVLEAMGHARFSVFEITDRHSQAGMMAKDLATGEEIWVMDLGLERTAPRFFKVAMRLIQPLDFWMSTGVAVPMHDPRIWRVLERDHSIRLTKDKLVLPDRHLLAEIIFKVVINPLL